MCNLPDLESQCAALLQPLDPDLHTLIAGRMKDALALELGEHNLWLPRRFLS